MFRLKIDEATGDRMMVLDRVVLPDRRTSGGRDVLPDGVIFPVGGVWDYDTDDWREAPTGYLVKPVNLVSPEEYRVGLDVALDMVVGGAAEKVPSKFMEAIGALLPHMFSPYYTDATIEERIKPSLDPASCSVLLRAATGILSADRVVVKKRAPGV